MKSRIIIFIAFVLVTAFLCFHHEPWRDEIDSWLMARDASLATIIEISPNAGTPALWYFLLKPLAASGFPFFSQAILNLVFVALATSLIIFQSPFTIPILLSVCFSWFLSFEYSVVARNYGLGLLGLFLILGSWSSRLKPLVQRIQFILGWPLLCFGSVHFLSLVPGLFLLDWIENKSTPRKRIPVRLYLWPVFVFVISVYLLWPTGKGQMPASFFQRLNLSNWFTAMSMAVFPFFKIKSVAVILAPFIIFRVFKISNPFKTQRHLIYFMFWSVNAIFIFKYFYPGPRHAGFNWILLVVSAWVGLHTLKKKDLFLSKKVTSQLSLIFGVLALINTPDVLNHWIKEVRLPFTDAYKTAQFLEQSGLVNKPLSCFPDDRCSSILGYLKEKKQFWYPGLGAWGTHMFWDSNYAKSVRIGEKEAFNRAYSFFTAPEKPEEFVFISAIPLEGIDLHEYQLVFSDSVEGWLRQDEAFFVYSKNPAKK